MGYSKFDNLKSIQFPEISPEWEGVWKTFFSCVTDQDFSSRSSGETCKKHNQLLCNDDVCCGTRFARRLAWEHCLYIDRTPMSEKQVPNCCETHCKLMINTENLVMNASSTALADIKYTCCVQANQKNERFECTKFFIWVKEGVLFWCRLSVKYTNFQFNSTSRDKYSGFTTKAEVFAYPFEADLMDMKMDTIRALVETKIGNGTQTCKPLHAFLSMAADFREPLKNMMAVCTEFQVVEDKLSIFGDGCILFPFENVMNAFIKWILHDCDAVDACTSATMFGNVEQFIKSKDSKLFNAAYAPREFSRLAATIEALLLASGNEVYYVVEWGHSSWVFRKQNSIGTGMVIRIRAAKYVMQHFQEDIEYAHSRILRLDAGYDIIQMDNFCDLSPKEMWRRIRIYRDSIQPIKVEKVWENPRKVNPSLPEQIRMSRVGCMLCGLDIKDYYHPPSEI